VRRGCFLLMIILQQPFPEPTRSRGLANVPKQSYRRRTLQACRLVRFLLHFDCRTAGIPVLHSIDVAARTHVLKRHVIGQPSLELRMCSSGCQNEVSTRSGGDEPRRPLRSTQLRLAGPWAPPAGVCPSPVGQPKERSKMEATTRGFAQAGLLTV
jgi:hypothetical protein